MLSVVLGKPTPASVASASFDARGVLAECSDEGVARAVLVLAPLAWASRVCAMSLRRIKPGEAVSKLIGRGDPMKTRAL